MAFKLIIALVILHVVGMAHSNPIAEEDSSVDGPAEPMGRMKRQYFDSSESVEWQERAQYDDDYEYRGRGRNAYGGYGGGGGGGFGVGVNANVNVNAHVGGGVGGGGGHHHCYNYCYNPHDPYCPNPNNCCGWCG